MGLVDMIRGRGRVAKTIMATGAGAASYGLYRLFDAKDFSGFSGTSSPTHVGPPMAQQGYSLGDILSGTGDALGSAWMYAGDGAFTLAAAGLAVMTTFNRRFQGLFYAGLTAIAPDVLNLIGAEGHNLPESASHAAMKGFAVGAGALAGYLPRIIDAGSRAVRPRP